MTGEPTYEAIQTAGYAGIVASLASIVAALIAIKMLRTINKNQLERRAQQTGDHRDRVPPLLAG